MVENDSNDNEPHAAAGAVDNVAAAADATNTEERNNGFSRGRQQLQQHQQKLCGVNWQHIEIWTQG